MTKLVATAALVLWFAAPVHAQYMGGSINAGGGSGMGHPSFPSLASAPPAHFEVRAVTGGGDFVPSTFEPFEEAVAEGRAELSAGVKTLGEVARENSKTARSRARLQFVQDHRGKAVVAQVAAGSTPSD